MSVTVRVAKPSGCSATAGVNEVTLSWNESGDSTITKYQVQRDGGDWTDITGSGRSTTGHTVTGLDNGTEYSFAIRAVNRAGNGVASDTVTATPFVSPVLTLSADSTAVSEDPAASIESNAPDNPGEKVTVTVTLDPAPTGGNRYEDCNLRAAATGSSAGADDYFIPAKGKHLIARFGWTQTFNFWVIDDALDDDDETLVLEAFCTGLSAGNPPPVAPEDLQTTQLTFTIADNDVFAPAQPTDFTATAGDTEVTLSWADPSDGTITSYQYRQSDDGGSNWDPDWTAISGSGATTTGHTLSGLTNGTEYSFQIRAVNEIGAGTESDTESATPLPPLPAEPTGAALIIGDGQATLSWNDPGDSTITKYQYRLVSLGTWYDVPDSAPGGANAASYTITGLTNGTEYAFYLRAVNIAGESGVATLGFARAGAPRAPGDWEAALSWSAPANNGAAISGYRYQWIVGGTSGSGWIDIPDSAVGGANAIAYTVTGLTNGTTYRFSVRAVNSRGEGRVSLQKNVTPAPKPAQPTGFGATAEDGQVTLGWTDPGDSTITSYEYRQSANGGINWDPDWTAISGSGATTTGHTVTGLTNGTEYSFQIRAVNEIGEGAASATESATPLPPLPAEPTGAALTIGDGQATLSWNDPGDASITKYQYRLTISGVWHDIPDSAPGEAHATSYTVPGLTNGTEYFFWLRAVNIAGESGDVYLGGGNVGAPRAPGDVTATAGDGEAALSWSAPADNGAAISGYQYQWVVGPTRSSAWIDIPDSAAGGANANAYTVSGLTNGATYRFYVRAVNSRGAGLSSLRKDVTPAPKPAQPTDFTATAGDTEVTLSWSDPSDSTITSYEYTQDGGTVWTDIPDSAPGEDNAVSYTVTGLDNGTEYSFQIRAVNSAGDGAASDSESATPLPQKPEPPTNFTATAGDTEVTLSWADPSNGTITKYQYTEDGGTTWTDIPGSGATTTSYTVTGLTNGTQYTFQVRAVSNSGDGAASDRVITTPGRFTVWSATISTKPVAENGEDIRTGWSSVGDRFSGASLTCGRDTCNTFSYGGEIYTINSLRNSPR